MRARRIVVNLDLSVEPGYGGQWRQALASAYEASLIALRIPVRVVTPSLVKMWDTWVSTVRTSPTVTSWRPPASQARRDELAIAYAKDGYALLEAVYDAAAPAWLRELPGDRHAADGRPSRCVRPPARVISRGRGRPGRRVR